MIDQHEYAILGGFNRALIGRYLAIASASIAGAVVYVLLLAIDLSKRYGVHSDLPPSILSLVGAGSVYIVLYWILDRYAWKVRFLGKFLKVSDLSGKWRCDGQTINPDKSPGQAWTGNVTIVQSWDKIRIRLRTAQSASVSITAALVYDDVDGCRILYNYVNQPEIDELDLKGHRGSAEMTFSSDGQKASGEYFNGHGRFTFGKMTWSKEVK